MISETEKATRIAIVNAKKCKPKKCNQECKRICPVVRMGKLCIEVEPTSKIANISESLCIGCNMCVKSCPFNAINIIKLPTNLENNTIFRYGLNSFKLHHLPYPKRGSVLGLVGRNGTGKSTAVKILSLKIKPNFGLYENDPSWEEIINYFRGSELQNYFGSVLKDELKVIIKPQHVQHMSKIMKGKVKTYLNKNKGLLLEQFIQILELEPILDRDISQLSGGELQRFAIAYTCSSDRDVYIFDEPSSFLDIHQRIQASKVIRSLCEKNKYVIVIEHDMSILDYLSDYISCLYGEPGAYGVVTEPFSVKEGINIYLDGYIPTENMRFRKESLNFKLKDHQENELEIKHHPVTKYNHLEIKKGKFTLNIEPGSINSSEITILMGRNGTGKTTFIKALVGLDKNVDVPKLNVSYKPQHIMPKFKGTVRELLHTKTGNIYSKPVFFSDVIKPLEVDKLYDNYVVNLSGGEAQRVGIVLALAKPANVYLIDEPSAYLDIEQRIATAKAIRKFIMRTKKSALIVEHDFIMASYLADKMIIYSGTPAISATAHSPTDVISGMNMFLKDLNVTFRRDASNFRPRINKLDSVKDQEQKKSGNYFYPEV
jgi:ATP-binding cassette subfamily E protein 1